MPELPEVETITNDLKKFLPGLKIRGIRTDIPAFKNLKKELVGKKILKIERRAKNILIGLSADKTLLIHLKLTGRLLYGKNFHDRFIHLIISLSNGQKLVLSDLRKFARAEVLGTKEIASKLEKLGPEPLAPSFNFKKFQEVLKNKRGKIKQVLMNQEIISGIGNIYSDEILWEAGIHPLAQVEKLNEKKLKKIFSALKKVLKKAVKAKGDSVSDYLRPSGKKGNYQNFQNAYQMTGKKCKKGDGGVIERIKVGGRSAHFCPLHQKL